jgi:uncharacterized damage-inducible protein DinB
MERHFRMFAAYSRWANARLYDAAALLSDEELARDVGVVFASVIGTLNHLLVTDRIWMKRCTGSGEAPAALDEILFRDFASLREARENEDARIVSWIETLDDRALGERFTYLTTNMQPISQRLATALAHLFNHQAHHRGQAHAALTVLGKPSVPLDLAFFQRTDEGQAYA